MTIATWAIGEATIAGDADLALSELPVQFDVLPSGSLPPVPGAAWVPGSVVPLKRVVKHTDGAAAATVALVTASGQCFEVLHPDAATKREEVSLDFGDASRGSARTWARRYLNIAADARRGITIELIPEVGPRPYRDFVIGDNISVLGEQHRVAAIGFRLDARSIIEWSVDLDQPRMLVEERLSAIMRRFLPGGAGGRTLLPSPSEPSFPSNQVGRESRETWSANADPGVVVLRKNGVAITGATATVAVGETKRVTLTDAARRFTKKVDKHDFTIDGVAGFPELAIPDGRWIQEMQVTGSTSGVSITLLIA